MTGSELGGCTRFSLLHDFCHGLLARVSHHLTAEARNGPAITSLRLLAVRHVEFKNVGARHAVPEVAFRRRLQLGRRLSSIEAPFAPRNALHAS